MSERLKGDSHDSSENGDSQGVDIPALPSQSRIAELWANIEKRRKERVVRGLDKPIIIFEDTGEHERRRNLPTLSGTDSFSDVRYDEEGNVYTSWYQPKKIEEVDGKRQLVNPRGRSYLIFPERNRREDYLENLPQNRPVYELVFGQSVLLEEAIRQQQHILDSYQPGTAALEVEFAREVVAYTEGLALRLLSQRSLSRDDLAMLARETGIFLENVNLYDPRDPNKVGILDKLLRVGKLDTLGRANFLGEISKILATHAEAVERITRMGRITGKFVHNLDELMTKREHYRWRFDLAAKVLEMILETQPFKNKIGKRQEREAIMNALGLVVTSNLSDIRVNPYLRSALWATINIVGCKPGDKDRSRQILGDGVANQLFSRKTAARYIWEGNFTEGGRRVGLSIAQLRTTNEKYKDIENA